MTKKEQTALAAREFIHLIESGNYQEMKRLESFLKQAKTQMREMLSDSEGKRHEFRDLNMVAKFVPKKVFETDHSSIIEELLCYVRHDVVFPLISLDARQIKEEQYDQLKDYLLPQTYYVRPTLNKIGKQKVGKFDFLFGGQSEEELITEIGTCSLKHKELEDLYSDFKLKIQSCPVFKVKKKVTTPYGSISLCPNKDSWDLAQIYEGYGEDFLMNYGKVDMAKLEELVLEGAVPNSILSDHRKVTDIRVDFIVMQLDVEDRIMNYQSKKRINASLRRFA